MEDTPINLPPAYRAYIIGPGGNILLAHYLRCETDKQAISEAQKYAHSNAVELWQGSRKICFIPLIRQVE